MNQISYDEYEESSPVCMDRVRKEEFGEPKWLEKILMPKGFGNSLFDHARHCGDIAIYHPYGAPGESLMKLGSFCEKHKLRWSVYGHSGYCKDAIKIVIWRPQDADQLKGVPYWSSRQDGLALEAA